MSVLEKNSIDYIYVEDNHIIMGISDHLTWQEEAIVAHWQLLQDKLKNYIGFIKSGQLFEQYPEFDFYGSDGIDATSIGGYKSVFASNIYGKRIDKHFHCGHNLSHDPKLLMVLRAIGGIAIDDLSESEKEIAAKALECGYLRKNGNT